MKKTNNTTLWDVIVIGGGPAGMIAAARAAERGKRVLLLEKNPTLGKKLLITGGGRCNITNNTPDLRTLLPRYKDAEQFLFSAFTQFGVKDTLNFFQKHGVQTKEEAEGRMFPVSNTARSVWDALVTYMKQEGVVLETRSEVTKILPLDKGQGFVVSRKGKMDVRAQACILATGGLSRPETGSTGDGFKWLKMLGHTVTEQDVALVPIALKDHWTKKLSGLSITGVKLTTYENGVKNKAYLGKLLFTHVGISGPTVLNMSKDVGELLYGQEGTEYVREVESQAVRERRTVTIVLDLFPQDDQKTLREKLQKLLVTESNKKIKNALSGLIPSRLVLPLLDIAKIDPETANHSIYSEERRALVSLMKSVPLQVEGLLGRDKAVISTGGVALTEVNFKTMESRLFPGLYLVGDVLNVDRPSGGYSLQLCWTTGYIAGSQC